MTSMAGQTSELSGRSVVVIIGGGPAGSSCAIKLKRLASLRGINPRIILYEGKSFEKKTYYNQCLGVLSPPLDRIMEEEMEVSFPWHIIQREIEGYFIHTERNRLKLEGEHAPSYACRRVEFDNYLFSKVREMGVEIIPARVTDIDLGTHGVMVFSESNNVRADIVIGAFGLDDGMAKVFERQTSYRQPGFLYSVVTKIHPGEKAMNDFGNYLYAFLPSSLPYVEFGAITPKGNHLSMNIAGKQVDTAMMDKFLRLSPVKKALPESSQAFLNSLNYFKGKFPTLPAKAPVGNRYIMVGDAAGFNRPFKGKGINSAVITGIKAAEAIALKGISKEALSFYIKNCAELTDDISYGKALRFVVIQLSRFGYLNAVLEVARHEPALKKAFFNIVSGQETYKKTWQENKRLSLLARIAFQTLRFKFSRF